MFQLFYLSTATSGFDRDALRNLLAKARERNRELGVTGMLLYRDGKFAQVLEGDKEKVEQLFASIQQDERHTRITTFIEDAVEERNFDDWSMAFRDLSGQMEGFPGYNDFLNTPGTGTPKGPRPPRSRHLLDLFRHALEAAPEDL